MQVLYCPLSVWSPLRGYPCAETESMVASTHRDNLRTSGKYTGSLDAYVGPATTSWCNLFTGMDLDSDDRNAHVDSRNTGDCVNCFK